uniref:Multiprotein bridging factor type 1 n=1 Tax=Gymnochlora stellata TaxID=67809 RepID=B5A4K9_GYMST|nr:multiprotein bridging factor type 1 [Gymnochlora stellata]
MNFEQDWKNVVIKKKTSKPKTAHEKMRAQASGSMSIEKKYRGGTNKNGPSVYAKKIEAEDADFKHRKITVEFKKALMKARQAKKLSQKQLAQQCQLQASVIQQYENGKAIPNGQIISKLNRILGVSLPKIPKKKKVKD